MPKALILKELIPKLASSVSQFEKEIKAANGTIGSAWRGNTNLTDGLIRKILKRYPNVNEEWLETGEGEMFLEAEQGQPGADKGQKEDDIQAKYIELLEKSLTEKEQLNKSFTPLLQKSTTMPFKTTLEAALAHLKAKGIIKHDTDILPMMDIKSKGTVSSYASGLTRMSDKFKEKFENAYNLKLDDFAHLVGGEEAKAVPSAQNGADFQQKYYALLEDFNGVLKQNLTEKEALIREVQQHLSELKNNQLAFAAKTFANQETLMEEFAEWAKRNLSDIKRKSHNKATLPNGLQQQMDTFSGEGIASSKHQ